MAAEQLLSDADGNTTSSTELATGRCTCEAITYEIDAPLRDVLHCHCVHCRRASGNFSASTGCPTAKLRLTTGEALLQWYDHGYARYGFCQRCGSTMFWVAQDRPDQTSIKIGTLDDATGLPLVGIWFAAEAQPHITLDPNVVHHDTNGGVVGYP